MILPAKLRRSHDKITRRQAIAGITMALGGLTVGLKALGQTDQAIKEPAGSAENQKRTSIHQEVDFKAGPQRIYQALLDAKQFAEFSGRPAEIDPKEGGAFSLFGGLIIGRNIELNPDHLIVQAWRPTHWDPGIYSVTRFELRPKESGTTVVFDHTGFPEGEYDHLLSGWNGHYWGPLAKFLV